MCKAMGTSSPGPSDGVRDSRIPDDGFQDARTYRVVSGIPGFSDSNRTLGLQGAIHSILGFWDSWTR